MRRTAVLLTAVTHVVGVVAFSLLYSCMANTHWSDFTAQQIQQTGYLNPWRVCQGLSEDERMRCVTSQWLSNDLYFSSILGNIAIFFLMFFVGTGLVEIVLLARHYECCSVYRACQLAKVIFGGCATVASVLTIHLFMKGLDELVQYTHQHLPPYYVWWCVVSLSMSSFTVSCVQVIHVFRNRNRCYNARRAATAAAAEAERAIENIPLPTVVTRRERVGTLRRDVLSNATLKSLAMASVHPGTSRAGTQGTLSRGNDTLKSAMASVQPGTSRSGTQGTLSRGNDTLKSAMASVQPGTSRSGTQGPSALARVHQDRPKKAVRFQAIPEVAEPSSSESSESSVSSESSESPESSD